MAYAKIEICNIALAHLGAAPIRDFDENNKRARMSDVFFNITRDYILSKFDWPFARALEPLQKLVLDDDNIPSGMFAFQLPINCKTPRSIAPVGSRTKWEVIGNTLFTDKESVSLYYTRNDVQAAKYSDTFVSLVALRLALLMSPSITQDKALTSALKGQYDAEQFESWESDANIGNTYSEYDNDANNDTFVSPDINITDTLPRVIT